ncbi:MAG TPA: AraC family transcriptional regulator [Pyrinomonadaceae bacterium]
MKPIQRSLNEIAQLTVDATNQPTPTELPRILIIKGEVPEHQLAALYEPMVGFVVQGSKTISIGDHVIRANAPSYFVIPTETPATGRVDQGPDGEPYLSLGLYLNHNNLLELFNDSPNDLDSETVSPSNFASDATEEFVDAWLRMLRLLRTPKHIPALAPVYEREILFRVLTGPQGWRLRQLCLVDGMASKIRRAIRKIRENYAASIDVRQLAKQSGMGVTTFHRQFKQITGLSPIQFQKQLRLLEARKLLVFSDHSVSEAAFKVGYVSASQFNREYSRFFGAPPALDASNLKQLEIKD